VNGIELMKRLGTAFGERGTAASPVMVINKETGIIYTIKDLVSEVHDDADGSTTHWLEVEEY